MALKILILGFNRKKGPGAARYMPAIKSSAFGAYLVIGVGPDLENIPVW